MKTYQITKYNPANRNDKGFYLVDEWTAISDIGKNYNSTVFTTKEYRKVEDNYINVLNYIANELCLENFKKIELTKLGLTDNDYQELYTSEILNVYEMISDNRVLNLAEMLYVSRLILREDIHGTMSCLFFEPFLPGFLASS